MGQGLAAITAQRAPHAARLRDAEVLSQCAEPDILCLQELLSTDAQRFFDGVGKKRFTSRFRDDNRFRVSNGLTMRGCGLGIGSRAPLSKAVIRSFRGAGVGWDRFARKGVIHTQVQLSDRILIDLITVHLQAGYDAAAVAVREAQLSDLRDFIDAAGDPLRPFIVCGDFNIDGLSSARDSAEYGHLSSTLADFEDLGAAADFATYDPDPGANALARAFASNSFAQRIDYIFWRPGRGRFELGCTDMRLFLNEPLGQLEQPRGVADWASDHYGLSATFQLF